MKLGGNSLAFLSQCIFESMGIAIGQYADKDGCIDLSSTDFRFSLFAELYQKNKEEKK